MYFMPARTYVLTACGDLGGLRRALLHECNPLFKAAWERISLSKENGENLYQVLDTVL